MAESSLNTGLVQWFFFLGSPFPQGLLSSEFLTSWHLSMHIPAYLPKVLLPVCWSCEVNIWNVKKIADTAKVPRAQIGVNVPAQLPLKPPHPCLCPRTPFQLSPGTSTPSSAGDCPVHSLISICSCLDLWVDLGLCSPGPSLPIWCLFDPKFGQALVIQDVECLLG